MLAHEPVAMWEVLACMPLLCMYIMCSLVLIYQVLVVLPGVFHSLVGHSLLCLSPPSILGCCLFGGVS
jgi:hypothetical protein